MTRKRTTGRLLLLALCCVVCCGCSSSKKEQKILTTSTFLIAEGEYVCTGNLSNQYSYKQPFYDFTLCTDTQIDQTKADDLMNKVLNESGQGYEPWACSEDGDCPDGTICIEGHYSCANPDLSLKVCMTGCRKDGDCPKGYSCKELPCDSCPCPASCQQG